MVTMNGDSTTDSITDTRSSDARHCCCRGPEQAVHMGDTCCQGKRPCRPRPARKALASSMFRPLGYSLPPNPTTTQPHPSCPTQSWLEQPLCGPARTLTWTPGTSAMPQAWCLGASCLGRPGVGCRASNQPPQGTPPPRPVRLFQQRACSSSSGSSSSEEQ